MIVVFFSKNHNILYPSKKFPVFSPKNFASTRLSGWRRCVIIKKYDEKTVRNSL